MNSKIPSLFSRLAIALLLVGGVSPGGVVRNAAADELTIHGWPDASQPIPVSLDGFTGEEKSVLAFDLEIGGCDIVPADKASYLVRGGNDGGVMGQVTHRASKAVLLPMTKYTGGSVRSQAHALSAEIIGKITGVKGIARSKVAFKVDTGGTSEIYYSDYDGFNAVQVTSDHSTVAAPAFGPGGHLLYYTSYRAINPDIYSHDLRTA